MRRPTIDMSVFKERRQKLATLTEGAAVVLHAQPEYLRNNDVGYPYRQDTNFFYLTGFEEPESILVFRAGQSPETTLFVRAKDVERETWDGFRYGPEATKKEFKMDDVQLIKDFDRLIPDLLKTVDRVYYPMNQIPEFDIKMREILGQVRMAQGRAGYGHLAVYDSREVIGELRIKKSKHDVQTMRRACELSAQGHIEAMRATKPGVNERTLQGLLFASFLRQGAAREGYNSIVGSGNNATTLHYVFNDQECKDGDLVLIDAGGEFEYYTGDITRTFPVNGKFTEVQKRVYQGVLDVNKKIIAMVKPGIAFRALQEATIEMLTDLMLDLKLLSGTRKPLIDSLAFKKYYPHGVSHWLGMDVHDAGLHILRGEPRKLEAGMAFTVEPGLYIPAGDMSAPAELRGIGIRIEDNLVVTETGSENLTLSCPKEISELEAIIGKAATSAH